MSNRTSIVATLACALLVAVASPAHAADSEVTVRDVDATDFPSMELVVSVDGKDVGPKDLDVLEDQVPVEDALIEPLIESTTGVDIVLVIDTSGSMKGQPLAAATAAALRFVTSLPRDIRVGVMTFADRPKVLASLSADHTFALNALGTLKASGETALYDAAVASSGMFHEPSQRNVILLSDGGDTASRLDLKAAIANAKKKDISYFTVGLTSGEFDEKALKALASTTGGTYAPAATANLSRLYEGLAQELSNQFRISYDSPKTDGGQTTIAVSSGGHTDATSFVAPALDVSEAPVPEAAPAPDPAVAGETWMLIALLLCFLATFLILVMFMGSKARSRRDRELLRRTGVAQQAALAPNDPDKAPGAGWVPAPILTATEKVTEAAGATASIDARLERAGVSMRAGEFVIATIGAAFAGGLLGTVLVGNLIFGVLAAGIAAVVPFLALGIAARRRTTKLHGQLPDILMIIAGSLRAGHSFLEALDMVAQEVGEPGAGEFGRVVAEIRLGRSVPDAMDSLAARIGSDDFKWALLAVNIQREVGGNLAEVLDTVSDTMREREGIRRQIQVLTAEGRLSVAILTGLPIGVALWLSWVNPDYLSLLFNTGLGLLMTGVSVIMLGLGVLWMRKVVKIDV
ncbi:MAG: VWA domain-containing protein [Actinobacteria bacterium]|nr:VWA domain-containing protein [Actinomycetota bacterium]